VATNGRPEKRIRNARGEETRAAVLRAAEDVFAELGYDGARMDDVAERVGIRRASLVYHFRDKQGLYEALLDDLFGDLVGRYRAALTGAGSPSERMLRCIDVWAEQVEKRPGMLRISLLETARATAAKPVPLASRVRPIVELIADAVRTGQREGVFRDVDPIGFVMSVAGTTSFLALRTALLSPEVAPQPAPGVLAAELRDWVARVLFVD
jgi:TetR/AcrR family transcriptional regulator